MIETKLVTDQDQINAIIITTILDCIQIVKAYPNEYTDDMVREMNAGISVILKNNDLTLEER